MKSNITLAQIFAKAFHVSPSCNELAVWFPNEENEGNPPRISIKSRNLVNRESPVREADAIADGLSPGAVEITKDGAKSSAWGTEDYGND
jgi:hypothetical protein